MKVSQKRGKSVRLQRKQKAQQYFKMPEPYENDSKLRNRAEVLSSETDLRYNQSIKSRNPKMPKGKKALEAEIIAKETKQVQPKVKKKKK
jgi:hypothetical protein